MIPRPRRGRKRNKRWTQKELKTPHYRNHSCPSRKVVYETNAEAKRIARRIAGNGGDLLSPYDCPHCGAIHLGHDHRRGF